MTFYSALTRRSGTTVVDSPNVLVASLLALFVFPSTWKWVDRQRVR